MDSIRDTFFLTKEKGTAQANIDNRLANGFFEISKEFGPDQFSNNRQYLEAVIAKIDEQLFDAASLEGDEFTAATNKIQPLKDAAERALGRLKNQMPELWAEQPKTTEPAAAAKAPEGNNPIERFESALKQRNLRILRYRDNPSGFEESGGIVDNGRRLPTLVIGDTKVGFTSAGMELVKGVVQIMDDADVDASGNVIYTIDRISTPPDKRGKGSASKALSEITSAADRAGLTIQLEPTVMKSLIEGGDSLSRSQLVEWYKKNGFVPKFEGSDKILIRAPKEPAPASPAASPEKPAGRDIQPRAGEAPEAPYLPPEEVARIREFRVAPDGTITRVTEKQKSEYDRWRQRYEAIIKKRQQEAKAAATAAERERRIFFAEQNRRAQIEIDSEEQFATQYRKRAQEIAARDAKEAARLQKEADQAQARADALRLNFERGMDAARAAADIKRVETNRLIEVALSSEQPLIAPGLLLVDSNRLTVQPFRMAVATDTVRKPSVTTRTGILYLKNLAGFEGQTQGHQQAFFNYLFAEQIGRGKAIATEAFRGPMAAQQGINLLNSRVWVAQNSGARLVRLYKNADKAAGKDLVTYKVYGANGMLIKQANDAQDAVEAIQNLENRFIESLKGPMRPVNEDNMGGFMNQLTTGLLAEPASARPKGKVQVTEETAMQIQGFERYLPAKKKQ